MKKCCSTPVSCSQAQLGQATCLAVAYFISISCGPSTPSALYTYYATYKYGERNACVSAEVAADVN